MSTTLGAATEHLQQLRAALDDVDAQVPTIERWAHELHRVFAHGGRLLVVGNGGSAALAAHLTGELVGRYAGDRAPFPAIWVGADQAATTAILNDYGPDEVFARQVRAHARPGDVVLLLSTSGRSRNVVAAAEAALHVGAECWAMTGPTPNPVASLSDRVLRSSGATPVVQEVQQVQIHLICEAFDAQLARRGGPR